LADLYWVTDAKRVHEKVLAPSSILYLIDPKYPSGKDPKTAKKETKRAAKLASNDTFEAVAREWLNLQRCRLAPRVLWSSFPGSPLSSLSYHRR
jgi:hypothetical protein